MTYYMHCTEQTQYLSAIQGPGIPDVRTLCGRTRDFRETAPIENWEVLITMSNVDACEECDALVTLLRLEDV